MADLSLFTHELRPYPQIDLLIAILYPITLTAKTSWQQVVNMVNCTLPINPPPPSSILLIFDSRTPNSDLSRYPKVSRVGV